MKAAYLSRYRSSQPLDIKDLPAPPVSAGEVLVQVQAASINDWDWCMTQGSPFYIRLLCGLRKPKVRIPGVDIAGTVVAVGEGGTEFQPGDRVFGDLSESGFGGFAETVSVLECALHRVPKGMSPEMAASLPHAFCLAFQGLVDLGKVTAGSRVLINGAGGGVGMFGVQIARAYGAVEVTGVDTGDKADAMIAAGFDRTLDYRREDFTRSGETYDLVLDAKTDRSLFSYRRALSPDGVYVTVGGRTGALARLALLATVLNRVSSQRFHILGLRPNQGLEIVQDLYAAKGLKAILDGPFPFSGINHALRRFGSSDHIGKIVVRIGQENWD